MTPAAYRALAASERWPAWETFDWVVKTFGWAVAIRLGEPPGGCDHDVGATSDRERSSVRRYGAGRSRNNRVLGLRRACDA
jgi:hypothetical protein